MCDVNSVVVFWMQIYRIQKCSTVYTFQSLVWSVVVTTLFLITNY